MANPMPAIITTVKTGLLLLALLCAFMQWKLLQSHLSYGPYHRLADDVGNGRYEAQDAELVSHFLEHSERASSSFTPQLQRTRSLLSLYLTDLIAGAKGISPFAPSQDVDLQTARLAAAGQLKNALAHFPYDGDLWLRLAILSKISGRSEGISNQYLQLSHDTTPHEGWIMQRRYLYTSE